MTTDGPTYEPGPGDPIAARCVGLTKRYGKGDTVVMALAGVDVAFRRGQFTAIMGPSGSGKSTLMHCMAGLDAATAGQVFIGTVDLSRLDDKRLTRLRRDKIGFVFQAYNLVPTLTALENITLPADIAGRPLDPRWLDSVIDTLGLRPRLKHRPSELSGGQQQRVACARALAGRPEIVFADEPTGNLDSRSGAEVLAFLRDSARQTGQTIVMVTHDPTAAAYADRVLFLADGLIVDEMPNPTAELVLERMKAFDSPADYPADYPAGYPADYPALPSPAAPAWAPVPEPATAPEAAAFPDPAFPEPAFPDQVAAALPVAAAPAVVDVPQIEAVPSAKEELEATEAYLRRKYPDLFPADDRTADPDTGANGHHPAEGDPSTLPSYRPEI